MRHNALVIALRSASSAIFAFNPASSRGRIAWSFCPLLLVMIEQTSTLIPGPFEGLFLAADGLGVGILEPGSWS
jgi:hypothetical protein